MIDSVSGVSYSTTVFFLPGAEAKALEFYGNLLVRR